MGDDSGDMTPDLPSEVRHILHLCIKDGATFDFAAPLLLELRRRHPGLKLSVLLCAFAPRQVFRRSEFYPQLLAQNGIQVVTALDFLPRPWRWLNPFWRRALSRHPRDAARSGGWVERLWSRFSRRVQQVLDARIPYDQVLSVLAPDAILLDHRQGGAKPGRAQYERWLASHRPPVFLLPHAPHHGGPDDFSPYDVDGDPLPSWCQYWMPFVADEHWRALPNKRPHFRYGGYPGLDQAWLDRQRILSPRRPESPRLRCLFIIRRFLSPGRRVVAATDPNYASEAFLLEHGEFLEILGLVARAIDAAPVPVELVIKPHPSNDFGQLGAVMAASSIRHWRISDEPVYKALSEADLALSLYSTIALTTAAAGLPMLLLNSRTMDYVCQWPAMAKLYQGLSGYVADPTNELVPRFAGLVAALAEPAENPVLLSGADRDRELVRDYFPDGAAGRCIDEIMRFTTSGA